MRNHKQNFIFKKEPLCNLKIINESKAENGKESVIFLENIYSSTPVN